MNISVVPALASPLWSSAEMMCIFRYQLILHSSSSMKTYHMLPGFPLTLLFFSVNPGEPFPLSHNRSVTSTALDTWFCQGFSEIPIHCTNRIIFLHMLVLEHLQRTPKSLWGIISLPKSLSTSHHTAFNHIPFLQVAATTMRLDGDPWGLLKGQPCLGKIESKI